MAKKTPITLQTLTCKRCGTTWVPRVPNPKACPKCHQDWRTPPKRAYYRRP